MQVDVISTKFAITNPLANVTASSITIPVAQVAAPSGDGVLPFGHGGEMTAAGVMLLPYGVGSDTNTFSMSVFGWWPVEARGAAGIADLWVALLLASYTGCAIDSGLPGLANTPLGTTQYFCSAIVAGVGNSGISEELLSPAHGNGAAHVIVASKGARFLEVRFGTGGSVTSCNALWRKV